jgi:hypothetical protein
MSRPRLWYAAVFALLPAALAAQDTTRVPTVAVLKRVAEAVDGYPLRGTVYVVLDSAQEVAAVVASRSEADSVVRALRRAEVHGPLRASPSSFQSLVARCIHSRSAMRGICPQLPLRDIRTLSLVIGLRDGTSRRVELPLDGDALFLTMSAFDKFAFPYYARTEGVEAAIEMRRRMMGRP